MGAVTIGCDIGQKRDPTAIAVADVEWRRVENTVQDMHTIRHLERLPLGTPYPEVAKRIDAVVKGVRQRRPASLALYVDATGVGQPVVDLLKPVGLRVRPVYFTYGDRRIEQQDWSISLGKAWLVSRLQALLQTGRILLPQTEEARVLAEELMDYEIKVDQDANEKYGAFAVGTHDDLVTALGLAVQVTPPLGGPGYAVGGRRTGPLVDLLDDRYRRARGEVVRDRII